MNTYVAVVEADAETDNPYRPLVLTPREMGVHVQRAFYAGEPPWHRLYALTHGGVMVEVTVSPHRSYDTDDDYRQCAENIVSPDGETLDTFFYSLDLRS